MIPLNIATVYINKALKELGVDKEYTELDLIQFASIPEDKIASIALYLSGVQVDDCPNEYDDIEQNLQETIIPDEF